MMSVIGSLLLGTVSCRRPLTSIFRISGGLRSPSRRFVSESGPFVSQQPLFAVDAAPVAGKARICADDPVARNHDGDGVRTIGKADGTKRFRATQLSRQPTITERRSGPDLPQSRPNFPLKGSAGGGDRNRIDRS